MTPHCKLTHANRINWTHIKDCRKNTFVPQGKRTENELVDVFSNEQFRDHLSSENNKVRLNLTDPKSL